MAQPLTEQQKQFFETFGYLTLPGLFKDDIDVITREFAAVFTDRGIEHDETKRTMIGHFADQRGGLCALVEDPRVVAVASGLMGDDFNYIGSDGNYYSGDTPWHPDGRHYLGKYVKFAFYLDPVSRDTGALRVIPGSHRIATLDSWEARAASRSEELWGIAQRDVPAISLDSQPGDLVAFNHNLMHAAFGGNTRRRMFTLNLCHQASAPDEVEELRAHINGHRIPSLHAGVMRETASPERWRHLAQVAELEKDLPWMVEKQKREQADV